jgi:hypothetical protein
VCHRPLSGLQYEPATYQYENGSFNKNGSETQANLIRQTGKIGAFLHEI